MYKVVVVNNRKEYLDVCKENLFSEALEKAIGFYRISGDFECLVESTVTGEVLFSISKNDCYCSECVKMTM